MFIAEKKELNKIMSYSVAIYVRLSDEDRNKKYKGDESASIQNQKSMLKAYCTERNWDIYDIYVDEDYSGTDNNRPSFNRMLKDCENGNVNLVLCKDQSRFSRDIVTVETYINDKFLDWGVRFIGVADNSDSDNEMYSSMRLFQGAYNELYVRDISNKIRKTLTHKREQGQFTGSFAPYGYLIDPNDKNHLVIDTAVSDNVKKVFEMYSGGSGYRAIAIYLNEQGIPNPTAYKQMTGSNFYNHNVQSSSSKGLWTYSTIYNMVRNETYTGSLVQGKTHHISYKNHKKKKVSADDWIRVPNTHDAIIDVATWNKVQERLQSRKRVSKITQELLPLSGKVKCACCGKPMKPHTSWNKKHTRQYHSLKCGSYLNGAMNCTNTVCINRDKLEIFVTQQINEKIKQYCDADSITLIDRHKEKIQELTDVTNAYTEQVNDKETKLTRVYEDYIENIISAQQYKIISTKIADDIVELKQRLESVQKQLKCIEDFQTQETDKKTLIQKYLHINKLTYSITDDLIDTIFIGECNADKEREIIINWKI